MWECARYKKVVSVAIRTSEALPWRIPKLTVMVQGGSPVTLSVGIVFIKKDALRRLFL